jgi:hypothetical protein
VIQFTTSNKRNGSGVSECTSATGTAERSVSIMHFQHGLV